MMSAARSPNTFQPRQQPGRARLSRSSRRAVRRRSSPSQLLLWRRFSSTCNSISLSRLGPLQPGTTTAFVTVSCSVDSASRPLFKSSALALRSSQLPSQTRRRDSCALAAASASFAQLCGLDAIAASVSSLHLSSFSSEPWLLRFQRFYQRPAPAPSPPKPRHISRPTRRPSSVLLPLGAVLLVLFWPWSSASLEAWRGREPISSPSLPRLWTSARRFASASSNRVWASHPDLGVLAATASAISFLAFANSRACVSRPLQGLVQLLLLRRAPGLGLQSFLNRFGDGVLIIPRSRARRRSAAACRPCRAPVASRPSPSRAP